MPSAVARRAMVVSTASARLGGNVRACRRATVMPSRVLQHTPVYDEPRRRRLLDHHLHGFRHVLLEMHGEHVVSGCVSQLMCGANIIRHVDLPWPSV